MKLKKILTHRLALPIGALLALVLLNTIARPSFLSITVRDGQLYGSIIDILRNSSPLMLVSLGMMIVIATRGIDLSVGALMAVSGAVSLTIIKASPRPDDLGVLAVAIGAGVLTTLFLGVWNGFLVAVLGIQPIVATLILMVAGRGLAQLITGGFTLTVNSPPYSMIGAGYLFTLPFPMLLALAICGLAALVIRRSALGLLIESVGGNAEASRLAGVRSRGLIMMAYVFCGLCAGIAGLMISSNTAAADGNNAGLWIELDAILAVVIGGTQLSGGRFRIGGTIVGALLIQTLTTTIYTIGIPPQTTMLFKALVVTAVCLLQSPAFRAKVFSRRRDRTVRAASVADAATSTDTTDKAVRV
jgi:galactofuranose transport system permease protein